MAGVNGCNGDDKNVGSGYDTRREQKTEKKGKTTITTKSVFNVSNDGRECLSEKKVLFDYNGDGIADKVIIQKFDKNGKLIEKSIDKDGDGKADKVIKQKFDKKNIYKSIATYEYDEKGNKTKVREDEYENGKLDRTAIYEYDAKGNRTKKTADSNGDGKVDFINTYEYDANGNKTININHVGNYEDDGEPDERYTYEYDANGNLTQVTYNFNYEYGADRVDRIEKFEYDANGNVVKESYDVDGDGRVDVYNYTDGSKKIPDTYDRSEVEREWKP